MATLSFVTYFDINQLKFRIQDTSNYAIQGIDITNIKGVIKITTPRGVTYENTDYDNPDIIPSTSLYSPYIALPTNAQGYILAGSYSIIYSVLNTSDNSISTETNSYTYNFIVPGISINQEVDGYNSTFTSTDETNYGTYSSLTRVHTVTPPSGSPLSSTSNNSAIISYVPNIYSGIWTSQITSTLVYTQGDALVINAVLTGTFTVTAYLNDMNVIRNYIETFKDLYDNARATNKELSYRYQASLLKITTSYSEYDLALYYNDLYTAYQRTVDIVTELSDFITITFPEEIIPFENHTGITHNPVSISTPSYGVSINASQVLSFSLATVSSGGMMPALTGNSTDYLGGDGNFHSLTFNTYALKSDFASYSTVTGITASDITNWQTAYSWGNHASAGYALLTNVYTKTQLQTSGQSSVHWGNITNHPTTISGYGITDAMVANSPITGATHTKITYDSKGLVTGGVDLIASDIPNLPWSKITSGLPTTLAGYGITNAYTKTETLNLTWDFTTGITGKPTTISGYGITDAYTKTETDALTWLWSSITSTPTTLAGYGITDALSTSHPAANVINTGGGTMYLSDDGTYKTISIISAGSDTQLIYNDNGSYAGSSLMTFDGTIAYIDTLRITTQLQFIDTSTYIYNDGSGNLTFYDAVVASSYTLADLVGAATNFWIPNSVNIWYGNKVGIGGIGTFTEALEVTGSILADNFSTKYFRYTPSNNLLIGPNAGNQEISSDKLYIHNTNTTTPLIYGEFSTPALTFNADVLIPSTRLLTFVNSNVQIFGEDNGVGSIQLFFQDEVETSPLSLGDLRDGAYYSLVSAYSDYSAVISITSGNKTIWNRANYIDITGAGTKFLSDNGTYLTISSGLTVISDILKWDTDHYRIYSSKSEAGGSLSGGKLYGGTSDYPTATNPMNYDGNFYSTNLFSNSLYLVDSSTYITRDGSNNMTFTDANIGTATLYNLLNVHTNTLGTHYAGVYIIASEPSTYSASLSVGSDDLTIYNDLILSLNDDIKFSISNPSGSSSAWFDETGFRYNADYSSLWSDRNLVDKGYVTGYAEPVLGFTPEDSNNKSTDTSLGTSDTLYPSQNAVKTYVDNHVSSDQNILAIQIFS